MGTSNREGETPVHHEGVIPRAVRDIFEKIKDHKSDYDFCIRVAFVELYKEKLYDLLSPSSKIKEDCMVDLREDPLGPSLAPWAAKVVLSSRRDAHFCKNT